MVIVQLLFVVLIVSWFASIGQKRGSRPFIWGFSGFLIYCAVIILTNVTGILVVENLSLQPDEQGALLYVVQVVSIITGALTCYVVSRNY